MKIIFVVGTTCVGKSTFLEKAKEILQERAGLVEVGKEFRKRYPPERFRGLAAMPDTEEEAFEIYTEQIREAYRDKCEYILVDGQPRSLTQVERVLAFYPGITKEAWWLSVDEEEIHSRLVGRSPVYSEDYKLSYARITNDKIQLFPVIWSLIRRGVLIRCIEHTYLFNYVNFWEQEANE